MNNAAPADIAAALEPASVESTLTAVLEHVPAAAFVLGASGVVVHANAAGRQRIEHEGDIIVARLARAVRGTEDDLEVHATRGHGAQVEYLVIARAGDRIQDLAAAAAMRWGLTGRQRHVLACILRGYSNLRTSLELGISERTVEVHMTAIFERARCGSRTELVTSVLLAG